MARSRKADVLAIALPSSRAMESVAAGDDRRWKTLTAHANEAFAAERWREAEGLYLEALAEAEAVFRAWREGKTVENADPAPMLVVATANLAECWLRGGQPARAGDHLVALCRRLCATIDDEEVRQDVREQCFLHLRRAAVELLDKLPRGGWSQERTVCEVEQAKAVALRFLARNTTRH